jgi:hypothetical protein
MMQRYVHKTKTTNREFNKTTVRLLDLQQLRGEEALFCLKLGSLASANEIIVLAVVEVGTADFLLLCCDKLPADWLRNGNVVHALCGGAAAAVLKLWQLSVRMQSFCCSSSVLRYALTINTWYSRRLVCQIVHHTERP